MFCAGQNKLNLLSRNEGKIKAYDSCLDVRAWSHDIEVRDRYIREWIKSDMPICVIPVHTVSGCLKAMTRRSRGRSTPRCHPNCKSKVVLESICNSCHAMKECLKGDENFEKYFAAEEFETSHWPCEKCLDALKSLKMFWKIITERIFKISIPKNDDVESTSNKSVQSVAKAWQKELIKQALVVKQLTPIISKQINEKPTYTWKSYTNYFKKIITLNNSRYMIDDDDNSTVDSEILNEKHYICEDKATVTNPIRDIRNNGRSKLLVKKISRCTSFRGRTVDFGGDACHIDAEEINMCKNNLVYLQKQYNMQSDELGQLKTENTSLKVQLQNMARKYAPLCSTMITSDNKASVIPKPYESYCEAETTLKNIDSEMIITLKNCENENFKHVSMLQVLHKTNGSRDINENLVDLNCCWKNKQDPIKILTKVHNTFGAIVRRELTIANQRQCDPKEVQIDASYHQVHASRSVPSCSSVSSKSLSDVFASTTEV
ncbi:uncharacterized protein LOC120637237 isoform X1 [Pararge aegeria]|uniref:uncharacterized protein LOC120637237 isoform X1 n=1 Tax=Pararge aegeria TaxID=116150 RepID=UPI0019D04D40|nr:uncharacterized protein LOC120637237 isoform X1 [Pararge aegeria]